MLIQEILVDWFIDDLDGIISTLYSSGRTNYCSLVIKANNEIFQRIDYMPYVNIAQSNYYWEVEVFKFTDINNLTINSQAQKLTSFNCFDVKWTNISLHTFYNSWLLTGKNNDSLIIKFPDKETQTEFNLIYRK